MKINKAFRIRPYGENYYVLERQYLLFWWEHIGLSSNEETLRKQIDHLCLPIKVYHVQQKTQDWA